MRRLARRRPLRSSLSRPAPAVADLLARAEREAAALRHDWIGTEHVLVAVVVDDASAAARALRALGLDAATVRSEIVRIVGAGPAAGAAFDADALDAIGIDLDAVRARVDEIFGVGALDRAERAHGRCGAAAFGVAPRLKRALEHARRSADERQVEIGDGDVLLALRQQRESVAARILDAHGITFEQLLNAFARERDGAA